MENGALFLPCPHSPPKSLLAGYSSNQAKDSFLRLLEVKLWNLTKNHPINMVPKLAEVFRRKKKTTSNLNCNKFERENDTYLGH